MAEPQVVGSAGRGNEADDELDALVGESVQKMPEKGRADAGFETNDAYRPDIDGLRAVAVIAVVIFHLDSRWLPGGFVGVDVFFVISGFVVTLSMVHHHQWTCNPCGFLCAFYIRRLKRLGPALFTMVTMSGFATCLIVPPWIGELPHYLGTGIYGLFGFANRFVSRHKVGYWAPDFKSVRLTTYNPFLHLWSLGVEEQFYFFAPLSFWMAYSVNRCHGGKARSCLGVTISPRSCFALLFFSTVCFWSMVQCAEKTHENPRMAYYSTVSRLWEMTVGVLLAHAQASMETCIGRAQTELSMVRKVLFTCSGVGSVLLLLSALVWTPMAGFPFPTALPAVFGAASFIVVGSLQKAQQLSLGFHRLFALPFFVYVGKISYGLYLWHWPVFVLFRWTVGFETVTCRISGLIVTILLTCGTRHLLERPITHWRPHQGKVLVVMLTGLAFSALAMWALWGPLRGALCGRLLCGVATRPQIASYNHSRGCGCRVGDPTFHTPSNQVLGGSALPPCFLNQWHPDIPICIGEFQPAFCNERKPVMYLVGDSFAERISWPLQAAVFGDYIIRPIYRLGVQFTGCLTTHNGSWVWRDSIESEYVCSQVHLLLQNLKHGDAIVIIMDYFSYHHCDRGVQGSMDESEGKKDSDNTCPKLNQTNHAALTNNLEAIHLLARSRGAFMVIFGAQPKLRVSPQWCIRTPWHAQNMPPGRLDCTMSLAESRKYKILLNGFFAKLASAHNDVFFVDHHDWLCDDKGCNGFVPGTDTLAYDDRAHLSHAAGVYLAPFICQSLTDQGVLKAV